MNKQQVDTFEVLNAKLEGLYAETQTLVKKSPNDGVNQFKIRLVNAVIGSANSFLTVEQKPITDFTHFDENSLPSNSDVLIILSQYIGCLEKIRADNIDHSFHNNWFWLVNGKLSDIRTAPPKKLGK